MPGADREGSRSESPAGIRWTGGDWTGTPATGTDSAKTGACGVTVGQHRRELSAFSDVLLAVLSYLTLVRLHIGAIGTVSHWYGDLIPVVVAVWWGLSALIRRDIPYRLGGAFDEIRETLLLNGAGTVVLLALSFAVKHPWVSRLVVGGFPLLSCVLSIFLRLTVRVVLSAVRRRGRDIRHILVVGPAEKVTSLGGVLRADAGIRAIGLLVPPGQQDTAGAPLPVLGDYAQLPEVLHSRVVDQIAVTAAVDDPGFRPVVETAIREGKAVWVMLDAFGARLMGRAGAGQLVVLSPHSDAVGLSVKRALDVAVAAFLLALASPIMLVCAVAIKLDDPAGPVIFRQRRVGLHGREFMCYKFRSMVRDAEARRQELLVRNEMSGPVFKIRQDPRITPVGRFLRKYSLDELPQLWNVLVGDMSLVGPRPPLPDEVRQYEPDFRRRLAFRPGLTCLWQISGRNNVDFASWMEMDLSYVDNWSIWLDIMILLRTIPTVLFGSGM